MGFQVSRLNSILNTTFKCLHDFGHDINLFLRKHLRSVLDHYKVVLKSSTIGINLIL